MNPLLLLFVVLFFIFLLFFTPIGWLFLLIFFVLSILPAFVSKFKRFLSNWYNKFTEKEEGLIEDRYRECPYCKKKVPFNREICPYCGKKIIVDVNNDSDKHEHQE